MEKLSRIIQESVPGKQVTIAHVIASPGPEIHERIGVPSGESIGIAFALSPGDRDTRRTSHRRRRRFRSASSTASPARWWFWAMSRASRPLSARWSGSSTIRWASAAREVTRCRQQQAPHGDRSRWFGKVHAGGPCGGRGISTTPIARIAITASVCSRFPGRYIENHWMHSIIIMLAQNQASAMLMLLDGSTCESFYSSGYARAFTCPCWESSPRLPQTPTRARRASPSSRRRGARRYCASRPRFGEGIRGCNWSPHACDARRGP